MATGMLARLGRSWWIPVVYGVCGIVFGVIALVRPFQAALALTWAFGLLALAEGLVSGTALFNRDVRISKGWLALYALASIGFGVLAIARPAATAGVLLMLLAAWLVVGGVFRIVFAVQVRREIQGEWLIALSGVLAIVLGAMFVMDPAAGLFAATIWLGAGVLVYGVLQVIAGLRLRRLRPAAG